MEITYSLIESLVVRAEEEGTKMNCEFEVPGTGKTIEASAPIRRSRSMQSQVSRVAKRTMTNQLRMMASRTLRSVFGSGIIGRTASTSFNTAARSSGVGTGFSQEEKNDAVVEAFKRVAAHFSFNEQTGAWATAGAASAGGNSSLISVAPKSQKEEANKYAEFELHLAKYPVTAKYDKEILSRMLVELAGADGEISKEEKDFLDSFMNHEIGTIEDIQRKGELTAIECEEVGEKSKSTVYMLAWTISLVDFDLAAAERNLLDSYAEMLELNKKTKDDMVRKAKFYILEQVINEDTPRQELFNYAEQLELSNDDAQRCMIQLKKRG